MSRTWRKLTLPERRLTVLAFSLLPAFALGVRFLGLRRFHALVARRVPAAGRPVPGLAIEAVATAVDRASSVLPRPPTCLVRSLVVWYLLVRQGQGAQIVIGVRRPGTDLEAHAWVEVDGRPVNDSADIRERFAAFEQAILPDVSP